ncbi:MULTISPECIES: 1-acyl-sn-glycerol-3-phosphate acyltransferase [unclassified Frankia]|uniref:lysophospholipid acyltransferase family protein n=1 Tax=unclassified Frankia TaxID=2632575 RepID=UPI001EF42802|nr:MULTISPECIES: lysophospholipid acyltransferase family protein [unclassified Frankia]
MADLVYKPVARFALGVFKALDLTLDVRGQERVPAIGGCVVAINHVSYLDFALAGVPFWYSHRRLVRFMAKHEVFTHPLAGPLMRGMRHIPVDRSAGAGSYRHAVRALRAGELVGVFPEATVGRSFCLQPFKSGAARMAAEAGVPILPVIVWGSQRILTKGRPRNFRAARGTPVSITVGEAIPAVDLKDAQAGTQLLADAMAKLLADAQRDYPPPPPGESPWWLPAHLGGCAPTPEAVARERAALRDKKK